MRAERDKDMGILTLRDFSLQKKLVGIMTLISGITLLLASLSFIVTDYYLEVAGLEREVRVQTRIIALNVQAALAFDDSETATTILNALKLAPSVEYAHLYTLSGKLFAGFHRSQDHEKSEPPIDLPQKGGVRREGERLIVQEEIFLGEEKVGSLFVSASLGELRGEILRSSLLALVVLFFSLLISFVLSFRFQRVISVPIELLRQASRKIGKGEFDTPIPIHSEDEIGQLADAFRKMVRDLADQRQQLERATQAKSEFLANMSHEIRTPMNAVTGLADLALQLECSAQMRDYLAKIASSSRSLLRIINDILDFSKIEAGRLELEETDFLLREVFENLSDMFRDQTAKKNLELIFSLSEECHELLRGDPLRLEQVLMNLLSNAVKFTDEGEIEVRVETIEKIRDSVTLQFSVRDTGMGLTQTQIDGLFEAFVQADSSTTRRFGGTGLGLSISRRLVEMMSGRIWVESSPGKGTQFHFSAHFLRSPEEGHEMVAPEAMERLRVLVVDDNLSARQVLQGMLAQFTFEADVVDRGSQAVEAVRQAVEEGNPYRLVLVDWRMPDLDGIRTIRQIHRTVPAQSMPKTVLLTTFGREMRLNQGEEMAGIDATIVKPINCSLLFDTIMELFHQQVEKVFRITGDTIDIQQIRQKIGGARVLLVEDNAVNQLVAQELLLKAGLEVEFAMDGGEAVEKVQENFYDVVLMDIQMPTMDGYQATQIIRRDGRYQDLPILAMTAHAMSGDADKSLVAGMNDHVAKPIDKRKLYGALLQWIQPRDGLGLLPLPSSACEEGERPVSETESKEEGAKGLERLSGIDLEEVMERLSGNHRLFISLLFELEQSYGDVVQRIYALLDQEGGTEVEISQRNKEIHRLVHTVKGMAGNISAHGLHASAAALEKVLTQPAEKRNPCLHLFEEAFSQVMTSIRNLKRYQQEEQRTAAVSSAVGERDASGAGTALDWERLTPVVDLFSQQLSGREVLAEETFEQLSRLVSVATAPIPGLMSSLGEAVNRLDFSAAEKIWAELMAILARDRLEKEP